MATIILLALTVTLFAGVFAFVTSFPSPPAQNSNQFQANLWFSGSSIYGVNITHLTGPSVPGTGLIYVKSANGPNQCFSQNAMTISAGLSGASTWSLGQVWHGPFYEFPTCTSPTVDTAPQDNLTVYVVSGSNLLFSVILPGQQVSTGPVITSTWVGPSPTLANSRIWVNATITGSVNPNSVYVSVPGLTSSPTPMTQTNGIWTYSSSSGVAKAGTYSGFINASSGGVGGSTAAAVSFTVASSTSGLYVSLSAQATSPTPGYTVHFSVTQSGGRGPFTYLYNFGDGTSCTSSTSPTKCNTTTSHTYTALGTYLATVTVTDEGGNVSSSSVTVTVNYNLGSLIQTNTYPNPASNPNDCGSNPKNKPCAVTLEVNVWDNWTNAISVSGEYYINTTAGAAVTTYTIGTTAVAISTGGTPTSFSAGSYTATATGNDLVFQVSLSVTYSGNVIEVIFGTYGGSYTT